MTQTAVEWLIEKMLDSGIGICKEWREQAKEMERLQLIDSHIEGQRVFDTQPHSQWNNDQAEIYYNETYGSKGSDELSKVAENTSFDTSFQTEISDEEIEKAALEYYESAVGNLDREIGFRYACKWYREQLKQRQ